MPNEKQIESPDEDVSKEETFTLAEVSEADKKKQADYDKRFNLFIKGFKNLEEKYKIKLVQIPARLIYGDTKNK